MPRINLHVLIWGLSSLNFISFAQIKFIEFDQKPLQISNNRLHLIKVVDLRKNKNCIARVVETNPDSSCIDFKNGLESALFNYLGPTLTMNDFTLPVSIEILDFSMSEQEIKNNTHRFTTIELAVYHTEDTLNEKIFQGSFQKKNLTDQKNTDYVDEIQDLLRLSIQKINHNKEVKLYIEKLIPLKPVIVNHRITFTTFLGLDANNYSLQYYRYKINPMHHGFAHLEFQQDFFLSVVTTLGILWRKKAKSPLFHQE